MRVRYNNAFGEWLQKLMQERGITSSRQIKYKTGVSHTTIESILAGSQPNVETVIRIAGAFDQNVHRLLLLAEHDEIAEVWDKTNSNNLNRLTGIEEKTNNPELTYEALEEEEELLSFYRGAPEYMRPSLKAMLKAAYEASPTADEGLETFGRRIPARQRVDPPGTRVASQDSEKTKSEKTKDESEGL